jgi:hypothetical protein
LNQRLAERPVAPVEQHDQPRRNPTAVDDVRAGDQVRPAVAVEVGGDQELRVVDPPGGARRRRRERAVAPAQEHVHGVGAGGREAVGARRDRRQVVGAVTVEVRSAHRPGAAAGGRKHQRLERHRPQRRLRRGRI